MCIPAISSSIFGFPIDRCCEIFAEATFSEIAQMSDADKQNLREIILCNIEAGTIKTMAKKFDKKYSELTDEAADGQDSEMAPVEDAGGEESKVHVELFS